jgi:phage-related protein
MKDNQGDLVTAVAAVKLNKDATTIGLVVNEAQKIERRHQTAEFLKRACQPGWRSFVWTARMRPAAHTTPTGQSELARDLHHSRRGWAA